MAYGRFVVQVREDRNSSFGELSVFKYDDSHRLKVERRNGALKRTFTCIVGWQSNYSRLRDAQFRVMEVRCKNGKPFELNLTREITKILEKERKEKPPPKKKPVIVHAVSSRATARRAAKKRAKAKEGTTTNWRNYL